MTWIVGASVALGYAVGISDIRVRLRTGQERDMLQKLYPMARFIAAGFAGSVRIGFAMLKGLAHQLPDIPEDHSFVPQTVAETLSPLAKDIFKNSSPEEREHRSDLMLLGAHPIVTVGIPGYSRCSVYILRSPDFVPEETEIGQVVSIGIGSVFSPYKEVLKSFSSDPVSLMQMAPAGAGASSLTLAMAIQKTVQRNPHPGVSPHAHICLVQGGGLAVFANDYKTFPQSGDPVEFKMPHVATTWDEFDRMASADGNSSTCAVC